MKLNKQICIFLVAGLSFSIFLFNCAGSKKRTMLPVRPPLKPTIAAGVDSSIAAEADSLAEKLFVPLEWEEEARRKAEAGEIEVSHSDTLWNALLALQDSSTIKSQDTVAAIQKFNLGARQIIALQKLRELPNFNTDQLRKLALMHLDSARAHFEASIQLNPFDRNTRLWLARVYQMLAERHLSDSDFEKAAIVLENLIRMEPAQHGLYGRLGQIYMNLESWRNAHKNFKRAENLILETAVFDVPEDQDVSDSTVAAAIDSSTLFLYVYYQGEADRRLYFADSALAHFDEALSLSRDSSNMEIVHNTINWINWDDGNIRASEIRDSLLTVIDEKHYQEAAIGFKNLLVGLKTDRAKREINWRLSLLEYTFLGKEDGALNRLQKVVRFYSADTSEITAQDTMYKEYFESYGTICHNQGLKYLKEKKRRMALAYFKQSCAVPWKQRAKSYLEIAKLSINNPEIAIDAGENALKDRDKLNPQEELSLLRLLVESYKRIPDLDKAKKYFMEFRRQSNILNHGG